MSKFITFSVLLSTLFAFSSAQSTSTWNSYWIRTVASNSMCMDVSGAGTVNNALVDIYACTGGAPNELFQIKPWANDETYFTINPNHNPGACLTVEGGNGVTGNGARVVGYTCMNEMNQLWSIRQSRICSKMLYLVSKSSGKCITFNGNGGLVNGAGLVIRDCIEQYNQQWYFDVQGYA